jgi:hypothetical protein
LFLVGLGATSTASAVLGGTVVSSSDCNNLGRAWRSFLFDLALATGSLFLGRFLWVVDGSNGGSRDVGICVCCGRGFIDGERLSGYYYCVEGENTKTKTRQQVSSLNTRSIDVMILDV